MLSQSTTSEAHVNFWFQLPLEVQLAAVAIIGAVVGGQVNRGIYRLAWRSRPIGAWSLPHPDAPTRGVLDRIPIIGWWGLRRESQMHGRGYWLRPILIELGLAVGLAWLYVSLAHWQFEDFQKLGLLVSRADCFARFLRLAVLVCLLVVATFIDFDEKTIPDEITVTGTLFALLMSAGLPYSSLPIKGAAQIEPLLLTSPMRWALELNGWRGLVVAWFCGLAWAIALIPKTWTTRRGWVCAVRFAWASSFRTTLWWKYSLLGFVTCLLSTAIWGVGGTAWQGLLTAWVGILFGGGLVWIIRMIAGSVLAKEAMGFGDVTLLAMIGAFLGWQNSLIVFFLAPFAALVVSIAQWLVLRHREIAFGPYLSLAAVAVIVEWDRVWQRTGSAFQLGWRVPLILLICLMAMAVMLYAWRRLEDIWYRWQGE